MKKSVFLKNLSKILEIDVKKINDEKTLESYDFDSLRVLELMAFNDQEFPKKIISAEEIMDCITVADLVKLYGSAIKK